MRFSELAGMWRVPEQMFGDLSSLCLYDTLLLVDDSACMAGALWQECMGIAQKLISLCTAFDDDGIEMMFFNSSVQVVCCHVAAVDDAPGRAKAGAIIELCVI